MKLPNLMNVATSRSTVDVFGGYNHNLRIGDGEWFDMKNMSSDHYPVMSPRGARGRLVEIKEGESTFDGIVVNNGLCYIEDKELNFGDHQTVSPGLTDGLKTLVSMGAYVIILPDKKWVNIASYMNADGEGQYGDIEGSVKFESVTLKLCKKNGEAIKEFSASAQKPESPADGEGWIDISVYPPVLKRWYEDSGMWAEEKTYLRIYSETAFEKGDAVVAPEFQYADEKLTVYIPENPVITEKTGEYIVVPGIMDNGINDQSFGVTKEYSMSRLMPDMDFVIESGNRLWGCKYGETEKGFVNEIYASKLGDFRNWNSFQGVSTDSYIASIGADGPFTGAVNYMGRPVFFKENCMIEVYGSYPAAYQVQTTTCKGVQKGCENSLAIVNNVLFYKSRDGVCAFDGSLPTVVSAALGEEKYSNAVGGSVGNKYYISMKGSDENWNLFVYDTAKAMWHREDDLQIVAFQGYQDELYGISADRKIIYKMLGREYPDTAPIDWMVQSGEIGLSLPDAKYVTRLTVRMSLEEGSEASFFVQYDFEEEWVHLTTLSGTSLRSFDVPIRPKRCDHMKLKIEGTGRAKIYSITKTMEQGSEKP